nr:MAG: MC009.2R [Molluscum contagiosum virus]
MRIQKTEGTVARSRSPQLCGGRPAHSCGHASHSVHAPVSRTPLARASVVDTGPVTTLPHAGATAA